MTLVTYYVMAKLQRLFQFVLLQRICYLISNNLNPNFKLNFRLPSSQSDMLWYCNACQFSKHEQVQLPVKMCSSYCQTASYRSRKLRTGNRIWT